MQRNIILNSDIVTSLVCYLLINLPDWASPGNWLGPEGHADLKNPVDDPSLYNLCSFPLKLFKDEAEIMSSLNEFHLLTILSEKKCCLRSVMTRFLCNFRVSSRSFVMTEFKKCAEPDSVNYFIDFNQIGPCTSTSDHNLVLASLCSYERPLRSGIMRVNLL